MEIPVFEPVLMGHAWELGIQVFLPDLMAHVQTFRYFCGFDGSYVNKQTFQEVLFDERTVSSVLHVSGPPSHGRFDQLVTHHQ